MKTLNYVKILLLCVFTIGLASCGDDVYYTMQNSDDKLLWEDVDRRISDGKQRWS